MIKVMKKMFFYLPLAALALAACSSDEVVTNAQQTAAINGDQLQIVPVVTGNTRATSTTTSSLSAFTVRIEGAFQNGEGKDTPAQAITSGQEVNMTKSGGSWAFPTDTEYWWADKTTKGVFTAWAPTGLTKTGYEVKNDIASQEDVIVAYNEGLREDFEAGVPLNFQHVLSQIVIKALNKNTSDITVKVAGVKLMNAKNKGNLTEPTSSTINGTFDWASYDPWGTSAQGSDNYIDGANSSATTVTAKTLTAAAQDLVAPMLLMPQTLATADLTQETLSGNYLAILVNVTGAEVGYRDSLGHYYHTAITDSTAIPFTAKRTGSADSDPYNTYTPEEFAALKTGTLPSTWTSEYSNTDTTLQNKIKAIAGKTIVKKAETLYPKQGFGTTCDNYAYVGVDLGGLTWKPGYKYTYTLNFSKDGIGKSIADQPSDKPTTGNFPYGNDFETGEGNGPGEDIVDNPVQLFFTVTVDEWIDADAINKDM